MGSLATSIAPIHQLGPRDDVTYGPLTVSLVSMHRTGIDSRVREQPLVGTATLDLDAYHEIEKPPSIAKIWPVVLRDSSDARNTAVIATSSGSTRPSN